ncbi:MAG: LPS-assembly protein LptD [Opitutaceae bacterium]|jgi:LPS-assembly protein|nr:LPS-assembly protein LptD [Opitutaceae bacterium]
MTPRFPSTRLIFAYVTLCIAALAPTQISAQAGNTLAPSIKAATSTVDLDTREIVFTGNARATHGGSVFLADEIRWNQASRIATATGDALLQRDGLRLLAQKLTYNLATENYEVEQVRFGRDPYYFSAQQLTGSEETLVFNDAELSFGEPGFWTPTLRAKTITYSPATESIKSSGARIGLGAFQFLPVPSISLPLNGPDLFEITVDGGASSRLGLFARVGATVPIAERWRAGADIGLFTNRGVMAGPAFGYEWQNPDGSRAFGRFTSGYIRDSGDRGDLGVDVLDQRIGNDRGIISWLHRQRMSDQLTLNGEFNYWSDSEVLRDFRSREFFPVQVPDSFIELNYTTTNSVSGIFARAQPNDFHEIRQRLPELSWQFLPTPFSNGIIQESQSSIAVLRRKSPGAAATISSERFDTYYGLTRPWSPQSWIAITPVVGARLTHYTETSGASNDYTRALGEFGMDAQMRFSGRFDYQNELWNIDGLRHLITPKIAYRYIPDADKGHADIPQIDRRVFATYLEPLGLGSRRQIDDLTRTHTVRFALDQRLQTRDETYGSRDLVHMNLALDARLDRPVGARKLSALHTELRLSPASFLDVDLYHRATPGDWTLRELNTAITLHSADDWQLQFATHYLENDIQEFIAAMAYRFNEVWEGYTRHHFDSRRSRFVEQAYGVRQTIANRWQVGYELSFYEGNRRESDFGFSVRLDVLTF